MSDRNTRWQQRHRDPSPAEIREACREIQEGWSAWERFVRSGGHDRQALLDAEAEGAWPAIQYMRGGSLDRKYGPRAAAG